MPTIDSMGDIIDTHNRIREACYRLARSNPEGVLKDDAWLRNALQENDITLSDAGNQIQCYGSCYTSQTWDHEHFDFYVDKSDVALELVRMRCQT